MFLLTLFACGDKENDTASSDSAEEQQEEQVEPTVRPH